MAQPFEITRLRPSSAQVRPGCALKRTSLAGLGVLWVFAQQDGRQSRHTQRSDSFLLPNSGPVLPPSSRLLVTPKAFLPEGLVQSPQVRTGAMAPAPGGSAGSQIAVNVDCVIFEDGELVGPNESHCDAEIQSRKIPADDIVRQVRNAQARGEAPASFLRQVVQSKPSRTDRVGLWTGLFASQLLKAENFEGQLAGLEKMPTPPKFLVYVALR